MNERCAECGAPLDRSALAVARMDPSIAPYARASQRCVPCITRSLRAERRGKHARRALSQLLRP